MSRWLHYLAQIQRYPDYFEDLIIIRIQLTLLRQRGLVVGRNCAFRGRPIITLCPESSITIADRTFLVSRPRDTALGVNHAIILRTMRPGSSIHIHEGCRASGVTMCAATSITIGRRTVIGANAVIVDTDFHALNPAVRFSRLDADFAEARPTCIENDVFVGGGAMILKGVTIGQGAVVGAGAVVTKTVPPNAIVAGNPAKLIGWVKTPAMAENGAATVDTKRLNKNL